MTDGSAKLRDRRERDRQPLELLLKAQRDRKRVVADLEIPELVLQHDRHLVGKRSQQARGIATPGVVGRKADIEMMGAAQPVARDADQRVAHHAAQRALDHLVVLEQILRHRPGADRMAIRSGPKGE